MLLGLDVTHYQPPARIDWAEVAGAGARFLFVRATFGVKPDDTFLDHMQGAQRAD